MHQLERTEQNIDFTRVYCPRNLLFTNNSPLLANGLQPSKMHQFQNLFKCRIASSASNGFPDDCLSTFLLHISLAVTLSYPASRRLISNFTSSLRRCAQYVILARKFVTHFKAFSLECAYKEVNESRSPTQL